jgi:putative flippase GtrA
MTSTRVDGDTPRHCGGTRVDAHDLAGRSAPRHVRCWGLPSVAALVAYGTRVRLIRFAAVGGASGVVQLTLLALLTRAGWSPLLANLLGFILSAQLNFTMSYLITWSDRVSLYARWQIVGRWARFHASIVGAAALNMLVFALARIAIPDLAAGVVGIGVAALANFLAGDRFVFSKVTVSPATLAYSAVGRTSGQIRDARA